MNAKIFRTLEFDKVIEQLAKYASSSLGADRCKQLVPMSDFESVLTAQQETDEAAKMYRLKGHVPLGGICDIRAHLKRSEIGGMLNPHELMEVANVLRSASNLIKFFGGFEENEVELPILLAYKNCLEVPKTLVNSLITAIGENGEVLDSASETLRQLRHKLQSDEVRVREKLDSMLRSSSVQKMLSDAIVTIRNDRLVIPVKQEYRARFGGNIHDQSASGQTLFIEPQAILQLNNALQEVRIKIQAEIEKILYQLSALVAEHKEILQLNVEMLGKIDFACAKAKLGKAIKGSMPKMNDQGIIRLKKARHPFIAESEVVANDFVIGENYTTIVITGPNTGGKTVALKTVGLCTLMAMAGLQIPAMDESEVAVFDHVFADIGDEQSIEQSLSTFSSHMVNIIGILDQLDHKSLVLYDELGAGTDPGEGAALAIAILDESTNRGARVIATTHYPELKAYGYNRENVMNASVEFNVETLSPTFKLLIGVPGKSNAFEISRKLGLSERLIENAKRMIGTDTNTVENMIVALEKARKQAEAEELEANRYLLDAEKLKADLQLELTKYYDQKEKYFETAKTEATNIVEKAKRETDEIIKELRKSQLQQATATATEQEISQARKKLEAAKPNPLPSVPKPQKKKQKILIGDDVRVISLNQKGIILEQASEDEWLVQLGIMKMKVAEKDIEKLQAAKKVEFRHVTTVKGKDAPVTFELDLRGERYEDALIRVEKFLDDALLANYPRISIIHGHGTGVLRQGVRKYLQKHRAVKNIRFGGQGEGGMGVTIVEL